MEGWGCEIWHHWLWHWLLTLRIALPRIYVRVMQYNPTNVVSCFSVQLPYSSWKLTPHLPVTTPIGAYGPSLPFRASPLCLGFILKPRVLGASQTGALYLMLTRQTLQYSRYSRRRKRSDVPTVCRQLTRLALCSMTWTEHVPCCWASISDWADSCNVTPNAPWLSVGRLTSLQYRDVIERWSAMKQWRRCNSNSIVHGVHASRDDHAGGCLVMTREGRCLV